MSYPNPLGFAHSPASFDFAQRIISSNEQLDKVDQGPSLRTKQRDGELNWIRRSEHLYVARSRHGGILRISAENNTHDLATVYVLTNVSEDDQSEVLGQGAEEALRLMADRFEASPNLFRIVRDASQFIRNQSE